jgi:hypothetical protein
MTKPNTMMSAMPRSRVTEPRPALPAPFPFELIFTNEPSSLKHPVCQVFYNGI